MQLFGNEFAGQSFEFATNKSGVFAGRVCGLVKVTLAEAWPDAVREEIVRLNLVDAKVALPAELVERALKQGRILFTWKTLRSWIKPSPLPALSRPPAC